MNAPKVFVSYSWDSIEHQEWVRELASRLRANGVDAILDQWAVRPGDQLTAFMEGAVRDSAFVLVVCTPKYKSRADGRERGVGYEGDVMTSELLTNANRRKFIPILRHSIWPEAAPSWLLGSKYVDLTEKEYAAGDRFRYLLDILLGRAEEAPSIGVPPVQRPMVPNQPVVPSGILQGLGGISDAAQTIVDRRTAKPRLWEIRLFSQVFADEIRAAADLKRELVFGVAFGSQEHLDAAAAAGWMGRQFDELPRISSGLTHLVNVSLKKALGPPGVQGESEDLVHVAKIAGAAYREAISWVLKWRRLRADKVFEQIISIASQYGATLVEQIESWSALMQEKISYADTLTLDPSNPVMIDLGFTLFIPAELQAAFDREIKRLASMNLVRPR